MLGPRDPFMENDMRGAGLPSRDARKAQADSPGVSPGKRRNGERELYSYIQELDQERTAIVHDIESEDKLRKWYYEQLEIFTKKIESLPLTETYNLQADMNRRQLEYEIQKLRESLQENLGSSESIATRHEARLHRIHMIEREMLRLQQQYHQNQEFEDAKPDLGTYDLIPVESDGLVLVDGATNTPTPGEAFVAKPGVENNAYTSDRQMSCLPGGMRVISIATQTMDVVIPDFSALPDIPLPQNTNMSAIYHGAWPTCIPKGAALADEGSLSGLVHQETSSVMSFNSSNSHGGSLQCSPSPSPPKKPLQQQQQHLGTKYPCFVAPQVEMVYSLLSMLGTHDKDDMSRTLLAMSSSQDSCIAMRQSGCMPLLIQLLHGSDKDSGLLGNTRGSKAARARAAAALHNIVHSHPDDKRGRREARVLRLLEQIRAHCDQLRDVMEEESVEGKTAVKASDIDHHPGPAIAALMKLSFDEEHRHAICTLGGLQAIAELLEVDHTIHGNTAEQYNITMRRYACMALTNLTFGDGTNKALLCSMKSCMEGLVAQLHSQNEDLCQVAASVLRNLSWRADLASKKTLREVGAVTTLMLAAMAVKKESTLKSILSALWNLSAHCSENKADICAVDNALVFLVNTLTYKSPSKTLAIIENGGGILRNVSSHVAIREDYRQVLRQHGCLQILLKHLRSPSLTIVSNACGTLWNLSARCPEDQQALWDMGAVSMLKNLLHSKHKMISMGSAAALKNLLAARPSMVTVNHMDKHKTNMPSLVARKQRALEAEIDQSLSETCENVDSPRDSPVDTQTKKDDLDTKRFLFTGENFGVYQVSGESEHRRPMIRGQFFPRSGSGDSSSLIDNRLRSPQRVARSGSQDSVGSVHSDISHDRSRVQNMLAKSSKLLHERQGGSLDRRKDGHQSVQGYTSGSRSLDSAAEVYRLRNGSPANSRIMQVMKEVALNAGIDGEYNHNRGTPGGDKGQHREPQNSAGQRDTRRTNVFNYQNHPGFKGIVPFDTGQQGPGDSPNRGHKYLANSLRQSAQTIEEDPNRIDPAPDDGDQPINYSIKFDGDEEGMEEPPGPGQNSQNHLNSSLNNRPTPKIGNYVRSAFTPQQGMPNVVRNNFPPPKNVQADRNFFNGKPAGGNIKKYGALPETDFASDDQPTDYSRLYAEHSDEAYNAEQPSNYSNHYQDCADCKLEEARRTNDMLEQMMGDDDCVRTFYTEGTPLNYMSTATSLTDLSQHHKLAEANKTAMNQVPEDESQCYTTHFEKEDNEDSALSESVREVHMDSIQERTVVEAESEPQSPSEKPKTYCEEGTPICFSRVSSLSSLHSADARDRQDGHMKHPAELQSIDEVDVSIRGNDSNQGNNDHKKGDLKVLKTAVKDAHSPPGPSDSPEKEHKTVTWDDNHQVQETPLMYSRSSSLGSLSSFDAHSVHSSVMSDYSRRPSGNVSPSDLPDSPSETMPPTPRCKSPTRSTGTSRSRGESESNGISSSEENKTDTVKAAEAEERRDAEKRKMTDDTNSEIEIKEEETLPEEVPVTYATEDTPLNFSETTSLSGLSINHIDDELEETIALEDPERPKNADWLKTGLRVLDDRETDNNSSLSEVSEGEEDILAQCISSAMPNNSSRKMKKSASDHAIKKKVGFFKIDNLNQAKSKLPTKVVNTTKVGPLSPPPPVAKKPNLPPKPQPQVIETEPDTMKSYATEGTPLNFSRSGSLSDISVATSNMSNVMDRIEQKSREAQERLLLDESKSDNSSLMEDHDDLLSDLIQSAMPKGKSPKKIPMDRTAEGSESSETTFAFQRNNLKNSNSNNTVNLSAHQPRISVSNANSHEYSNRSMSGGDTMTTFAVEGTPINFSTATSLSDLTIDSIEGPKLSDPNDMSKKSILDNVSMNVTGNCSALESKLDDSVFLTDVAACDSPRVYGMEGTPMSFSRNDSLSSLGCIDDDDGPRHSQTDRESLPGKGKPKGRPALRSTSKLPTPCKSYIPPSNVMKIDLANPLHLYQREVVGQSSEESSQADTSSTAHEQDQTQKYEVEGTPYCFSRNSSLSSLHTDDNMTQDNSAEGEQLQVARTEQHPTKDQRSTFKVEGTPVCYSRNSSLSSLSIESSPTVPSQYEQDLLEECISSAMPKGKVLKPQTKTKPLPRGLPRPSPIANQNKDLKERLPPTSPLHIKAEFDADFATPSNKPRTGSQFTFTEGRESDKSDSDNVFAEPDSPYMNSSFHQKFDRLSSWRKQPHKSCDEIFTSSPLDGQQRFGWRRSHSQDSENFLKQRKDFSNFEKAQNASETENDDGHHISRFRQRPFLNPVEAFQAGVSSMPDNRMLEETTEKGGKVSSILRSDRKLDSSGSIEKVDSEKSEKDGAISRDGPFMDELRSTTEEISIEDIMKETFPDEITLDTDDDLLGSVEDQLGDDTETESNETTFENGGSGDTSCLNETVIHRPAIECGVEKQVTVNQGEDISPVDQKELEANANIVVSELFIERELSSSTLDEDMFIENETISLVSNGYNSDTASEVSISWSTSSKTNSEQTSEYATSNASQNENRLSVGKGPRILKPSEKPPQEPTVDIEDNTTKGVRGRRKPLYPGSRASSAASAKSVSVKSDASSKSSKPGAQPIFKVPANKTPPGSVMKKVSPKGQTQTGSVNKLSPKSRLTKPAPASPKSTVTNNARNTPGKVNGSQSRLPMVNGEKTKDSPPAGKNKAKVSPTERPKPPIKQGTFVMESPSTNGPTITQAKPKVDVNANKMSPENQGCSESRIPAVKKTRPSTEATSGVKLREKKNSNGSTPPDSQRNSGGSSSGSQRNSDGSPPDVWGKALGGYNFLVDTSQEKGYHAPYEQIQMQRNSSDCPEVLKRNNSNNSVTKTTTTTITVKISGSSPSNISRIATSNLRKTTSMSPSRCGSGSSLNRTSSAGNLKKTNSKADLKKSDSSLSLKKGSNNPRPPTPSSNNSRPPTPSGRRTPTSLNFNNKSQNSPNGTPTKRGDSATNGASQGNCVRKTAPGTVGKKQITSKIASLWKKDDGSNSSLSSNEKSPPSESKMPPPKSTKPSTKPATNKPALPVKPKISPPKPVRVDSLPANQPSPREGLSRSSTYDKISSCVDSVPADEAGVTTGSKSGTWRKASAVSDEIPGTSTDVWHCSDSSLNDSPSPVDTSGVVLRENRRERPQINSGTWTKDKPETRDDTSSLPDADETFGGTVWRRYDSSEQEDSDDPEVWVKRDGLRTKDTNIAETSYQIDANASVSNISLSNVSDMSIMNASDASMMNASNASMMNASNASMMNASNASMMNSSTASTSSGIRRLTRSFASSSLKKASLSSQLPASLKSPNDRIQSVRQNGQVTGIPELKSMNMRRIPPPFAPSAPPSQLDISKTGLEGRLGTTAAAIVAPFNYNPTPNATTTVSQAVTETDGKSDPNAAKRAAIVSPTKHMTKTEMLLARRRSYLNNVKNENAEGEEKKRTCLVTTV